MKSTGIIRKIDELGRVVIPKELRNNLGLQEKDGMEVFVEGEQIILQKHVSTNACVITGEVSPDNIQVAGKWFSREAAQNILNALGAK